MKFRFAPSLRPPTISQEDWNSWSWQVRKSPKSLGELEDWVRIFSVLSSQQNKPLEWSESFRGDILLLPEECEAFCRLEDVFSFRVTPYYLSLIDFENANDPIRKIALPRLAEISHRGQQLFDPLGERRHNPVSRIIHRYSDRVLFLVTDFCSVYCRYCTRKHFTGQEQVFPKEEEYQTALNYIREHPGIREVILSGGDPLTLSNAALFRVLKDLRRIDHLEIIRLGTRMPVVCPMRVDEELVRGLREYKPVFVMTHFNHPRELTGEAAQALEGFVDHGVPVFNQMVLLNGVNNDASIVQALNRRLLYLRVKPYYMFQCDPSMGSEHFRTPVEEGEIILRELWGHLSGLAMPIFSLDIPDGGGKVTLVPSFEQSREPGRRLYQGWDGHRAWYENPITSAERPRDVQNYQSEWDSLKNAKVGLRHSGND